jgi:hypothetical protein
VNDRILEVVENEQTNNIALACIVDRVTPDLVGENHLATATRGKK